MRIFADHCVYTEVVEALRRAGFKVQRAKDKGLAKASDEEIFIHILKTSQVLLTLDKDFGNIIRFNISASKGVVITYIEGMSRKDIIQRITGFFQRVNPKLLRRSLFIIEPDKVRVWRH